MAFTSPRSAADPQGANPNGIYNSNMGGNARGGITFTAGNPGGSKYAVKTNMGNTPVNFVSWYDALRFANWMHNGRGAGSTEDGAYLMSEGAAVVRKEGAQVFLPTSDEWHKAAYYKGGGTNAGYWEYATQSNAVPAAVTADAVGNGSAGPSGNSANWNEAADWNAQDGNVTSVGTNGGAGYLLRAELTGVEISELRSEDFHDISPLTWENRLIVVVTV